MQDLKMSPVQDQTSQARAHKEPYAPPTVTVIHLKMEERLLTCSKFKPTPTGCRSGNKAS